MSYYPEHFRDLAGWGDCNITLSTTSDQVAKLYDAALSQSVYMYNHPQYGGVMQTINKMLAIDPNFVMGSIMKLTFENFVTRPLCQNKLNACLAKLPSLNQQEKLHVGAVNCLSKEDLLGALEQYHTISKLYPHDMLAIHQGYLLALVTGRNQYLRDIPSAVVEHYKPHTPYYGHIHGKLCFAQAELGLYAEARESGGIAVESLCYDSWAHHAMAHVYENEGKPKDGIVYLEHTESQWVKGTNFKQHLHWHNSLFYSQIQDSETALSLYDQHIAPVALAEPGHTFPLTDAVSLLARLELQGVKVESRMKGVCAAWAKHDNEFTNLYCDANSCVSKMLAGERAQAERLIENMQEYINSSRAGHNKEVTMRYGIPLLQGLQLFYDKDYGKAVEVMKESVPACLTNNMYGSKAQKDVFSLLFVEAGIRSGAEEHVGLAQAVLEGMLVGNKVKELGPLHQTMYDRAAQRQANKLKSGWTS